MKQVIVLVCVAVFALWVVCAAIAFPLFTFDVISFTAMGKTVSFGPLALVSMVVAGLVVITE